MQKRKTIRRLCERSRKVEKREYLRPGGVRGVELCSEVDRHSACDVGDRKCKSEYAHAEEGEDKHDEKRPVFGARHVVRRDCRSTVEKRGRREQEGRRCFMLELEAQTLTRGKSPTLNARYMSDIHSRVNRISSHQVLAPAQPIHHLFRANHPDKNIPSLLR